MATEEDLVAVYHNWVVAVTGEGITVTVVHVDEVVVALIDRNASCLHSNAKKLTKSGLAVQLKESGPLRSGQGTPVFQKVEVPRGCRLRS